MGRAFKRSALTTAIVFLVFYALASFAAWDCNPVHWGVLGRAFLVVVAAFTATISCALSAAISAARSE